MAAPLSSPPPTASPPVPYTLFTKNERRWIVAMIALAGWFSTLSSFIYYPAIPVIADDLGASIGMVDLTVTSYLIVSAIAPAVVGDAADTFGRRPLYAITLTLYVVANVGIALQRSAVALLLLRMLQSAGISGEQTASFTQCDRVNDGGRNVFRGLRSHCRHLDTCREGRLCLGSFVRVSILSELKKSNC